MHGSARKNPPVQKADESGFVTSSFELDTLFQLYWSSGEVDIITPYQKLGPAGELSRVCGTFAVEVIILRRLRLGKRIVLMKGTSLIRNFRPHGFIRYY